jgi:hypothetical protein
MLIKVKNEIKNNYIKELEKQIQYRDNLLQENNIEIYSKISLNNNNIKELSLLKKDYKQKISKNFHSNFGVIHQYDNEHYQNLYNTNPNKKSNNLNNNLLPKSNLNNNQQLNRINIKFNTNINSNYNINSIEKTQLKNNIDRIKLVSNTDQKFNHNSRDIKIIPVQREKEPIDNQKINTNNTGKIILINNNNIEKKMKKKSLSCSKNMKETNFKYITTQRPSVYISSNSINKKLNFEEPSNNTKVIPPESSKELNNYFFNLKSNEQLKEKKELEERPFIKKEIIIPGNKNQTSQYKKYLLTKKSFHNSAKPEQKLIKDNIINRKKYFDINNNDVKKFNITLEIEPQDNYKRKSVNKYYDNLGRTSNNDLNKSYNKAKTIIINNNIQINTLINDKSKNLYLLDKDGFKYNYEHKNEKKNLSSKSDIKNIRNNANKSNIIF